MGRSDPATGRLPRRAYIRPVVVHPLAPSCHTYTYSSTPVCPVMPYITHVVLHPPALSCIRTPAASHPSCKKVVRPCGKATSRSGPVCCCYLSSPVSSGVVLCCLSSARWWGQ